MRLAAYRLVNIIKYDNDNNGEGRGFDMGENLPSALAVGHFGAHGPG